MARKWTQDEEQRYRTELHNLYVRNNKTIGEIGAILGLAPQTVFQRLQRLGVPISRLNKERSNNKRNDVFLPRKRSPKIAEFFGIMLGDGNLSHFQVMVTLGNKESTYARYVQGLMQELFGGIPKITTRKTGYVDVYLGSTRVTQWLMQEGLVFHKVTSQVNVPQWIFSKKVYIRALLRGFFDTDGSVYELRHGIQISFTNMSNPLLHSLHNMLCALGYSPSAISAHRVYLTKRTDIERFFHEIQPANAKHRRRFQNIKERRCVGTQVVNEDWL